MNRCYIIFPILLYRIKKRHLWTSKFYQFKYAKLAVQVVDLSSTACEGLLVFFQEIFELDDQLILAKAYCRQHGNHYFHTLYRIENGHMGVLRP